MGQPVGLRGVVVGGADDTVGFGAAGRIQIDAAEHVPRRLDVPGGGVPLGGGGPGEGADGGVMQQPGHADLPIGIGDTGQVRSQGAQPGQVRHPLPPRRQVLGSVGRQDRKQICQPGRFPFAELGVGVEHGPALRSGPQLDRGGPVLIRGALGVHPVRLRRVIDLLDILDTLRHQQGVLGLTQYGRGCHEGCSPFRRGRAGRCQPARALGRAVMRGSGVGSSGRSSPCRHEPVTIWPRDAVNSSASAAFISGCRYRRGGTRR